MRATRLRQGQHWDWRSPAHFKLGPRLLEALRRVHELGIRHGDLHPGNILVTPDDAVFVLDFDGCETSAPAWALDQEQRFFVDFFVDHDVSLILHLQRCRAASTPTAEGTVTSSHSAADVQLALAPLLIRPVHMYLQLARPARALAHRTAVCYRRMQLRWQHWRMSSRKLCAWNLDRAAACVRTWHDHHAHAFPQAVVWDRRRHWCAARVHSLTLAVCTI